MAKNLTYFCIERDPATDDSGPIYHVGVAVGHKPSTQGPGLPVQFPGKCNFPYEPRKLVFSTGDLDEAFKHADLLIPKLIEDGNLRAM